MNCDRDSFKTETPYLGFTFLNTLLSAKFPDSSIIQIHSKTFHRSQSLKSFLKLHSHGQKYTFIIKT
jgi:hypothetical protein